MQIKVEDKNREANDSASALAPWLIIIYLPSLSLIDINHQN